MLEVTSLPIFITHATANINLQKQLYQCVTALFLKAYSFIVDPEQLRCWLHLLFCWHNHSLNTYHDCKYTPQTSQPCVAAFRYALVFLRYHDHIFVISWVRVPIGCWASAHTLT
jgi:hypothetical protein